MVTPKLTSLAEFAAMMNDPVRRKKHEELFLRECPDCHKKYDDQTLVNEPFRTIVESATNHRKVCVDCYWKWVGESDDPKEIIRRYFGRIEETPLGFCYVKDLDDDQTGK